MYSESLLLSSMEWSQRESETELLNRLNLGLLIDSCDGQTH